MGLGEMLPVEISSALERGALVLTANERAARALRHGFDRRNRAAGLARWQPPAVMSWDAWLGGLWRGMVMQGQAAQVLLNRTQEHAVWRRVLENDPERKSLRSVDSLAEMAAEAWGLLWSYNGQGRLREMPVSTDTRAFQRWAVEFERRCRAEGYVSQAQLEEMLRGAVVAGRLEIETQELVLVGFDVMAPAQGRLIEAVREAGVGVEEVLPGGMAERTELVEAADEGDELRVCARWVRGLLEEEGDARVAVIVPGLEGQRAEIDRVFREVLAPELQDIGVGSDVGPYEFSLGMPLAKTAMGAVALELLQWVSGPLPLERVSGLLLSPYFAGVFAERGARAEFDAFVLRRTKMLRPEVSLEGLIGLAEGWRHNAKLPVLLGAMRRMRHAIGRTVARDEGRMHSEWAEGMHEILEAAGWGAGEGEDSIEFQTRRKWESALDELATLDFDGVRVSFDDALDELTRIAERTMFAPESREAPVQVMGPLEAAGCEFDAVWFLRAGDLSWPVRPSASPLLPWQMQREMEVPGTDATKDSEYARLVTERIAKSAGAVIFSYAKECKEGRQRASAALEGLGLEAVVLVNDEVERAVLEIETMEDGERLPLLPDEVIRGGAKILQLQAACGFRAFAEQRLWSTELRESELGMDAADRGNVVHEVLESFWREVKTQSELKAMSDAEREEMLAWAIGEGLKKSEALSTSASDVEE
jgi:ATP-dependent helicase/nuclease subunit B